MSSRVLVALRVAVPQARAFHVFVHDIGAWWQPDGLFRTAPGTPGRLAFQPRPGGALTETPAAGEPYEIGRIIIWEPPARLVFSWRQPDFPDELHTEVEVTFEAVANDVTRVSVEHRGFHQVPAESAARHGFPDSALQMRLAEWWHAQLRNVAAACRGQP